MAISGLFTTLGISKTIDAQNNEGFKIYPTSFGISRNNGTLVTSRTGPNAGEWFTAPITSRVVVDQNSVKIICTIPPSSSLVVEDVKEICIYAKDSLNVDFLLAIGQPAEEIIYDPSGTVTLELQISLADVDLTSIYVFNNTIATELASHTTNPNAHPELMKLLADNGIFLEAGAYAASRMGQPIEYPVEFDGTKSTFTHDGVIWTATFNGTELNTLQVIFDGLKGNDAIRADFNAINYPNTIEHDGLANGVLTATTKTLLGGTYLVDDKDIVYKDVDNIYKKALADGSVKSRIAGFAIRAKKILAGHGFADINTGYPTNTPLYLSGSLAGKITAFNTNISIGICLGDHIFFTGYAGDISTNVSQEFDAVVTDASGVGQFSSTQDAIVFVPENGRILIKKLELVKQTIDTNGKKLNFVFNGAETGWKRFLGQSTIFTITFDGVATQGTWRMEWEGQESNDIPWNANAALVQSEFNLFDGHNGFTVTGNMTIGFTFTSDDLQVYSLPAFTYAGRNEIQNFVFDSVPDNGTFQISFDGFDTVNYAYNDNLAQLQLALDNLTSIQSCVVTGSFASGFTIEFTGGWLLDGNSEQNLVQAIANSLALGVVPVVINSDPVLTVDASVIQKGKTPASNLYAATTLLNITVEMSQTGEEVGPTRLMNVDSPVLTVVGLGLIEGFTEGLVLESSSTVLQLQARVLNTDYPVLTLNKLPTVNYDIELAGYAKDVVAQLRLTEHVSNKKRAVISGMDFVLPSGITLVKSMDSLKAKFTGAEIDFTLGKVYAADGVTDIGVDFTAPVITATMWKWFSVNLLVSGSDNATNETTANILILSGATEGSSKELAPKAAVDDAPIGQIAIRGALGEKEKTVITTIKDAFATPLKGTTLILYHPSESVAFYWDDPILAGAPTALALTATRYVKMTTLVANDFQATVANKLKAYIDADVRFVATVIGNKVTVENTTLGTVTDADMGDTGFFKNVIVQGTNTDASGIDDISNKNIIQFSTGSGEGGGKRGVGDALLDDLERRFEDSFFGYFTHNIFQLDKDRKLSVAGGRYVTTKKHWELDVAETNTSIDLLDPDFKLGLVDLENVSLTLSYGIDYIDANPVIEVSRDAGVNYSVMTMEKNSTGVYVGSLEFDVEPSVSNLKEYAVANANTATPLTNGTRKAISQEFTTHATLTQVFTKLSAYVNKTGSPIGTVSAQIIKDNAGLPSTVEGDLVWMSSPIAISGIAAGDSIATFNMYGCVLLPNTKYHLVFVTDAAYKTIYSAGVTQLQVRSDSTSPTIALGKIFDGTTWSAGVTSLVHKLEGRTLDLRVRITSATTNSGIIGYGIYFGAEGVPSANLSRAIEFHHFSGDLNKTNFLLTEFLGNPEFLEVSLAQTGQTWKYPSFDIAGAYIIFPDNTFNMVGVSLTLRFDQIKGGTYDNSDRNLALLTENHMGSQDPSLDKSVAGRGHFFRRPDGTMREVCLDDNDTIVIYSV